MQSKVNHNRTGIHLPNSERNFMPKKYVIVLNYVATNSYSLCANCKLKNFSCSRSLSPVKTIIIRDDSGSTINKNQPLPDFGIFERRENEK